MTVKIIDSPIITHGTSRTYANRISDVINVKDYGAVGDGVTDDWQAIQNALNPSTYGAEIFFPPGTYYVSKRLYVPSSSAGMKLFGCGSYKGSGSVITGGPSGINDYLLYVGQGGCAIYSMRGLGFINNSSTIPTSAEVKDSPDIVVGVISPGITVGGTSSSNTRIYYGNQQLGGAQTPNGFFPWVTGQSIVIHNTATGLDGIQTIGAYNNDYYNHPPIWFEVPVPFASVGAWSGAGRIAFNGDGVGCVYWGPTSGSMVDNCDFTIGSSGSGGLGLYVYFFSVIVKNCTFRGPWTPGSTLFSAGAQIRLTRMINCIFSGFKFGLSGYRAANYSSIEIDSCYVGLKLSSGALPYLRDDSFTVVSGENTASGSLKRITITNTVTPMSIPSVANFSVTSCTIVGASGSTDGIYMTAEDLVTFENISITGTFSGHGIVFDPTTDYMRQCLFDNVDVRLTSGTPWGLGGSTTFQVFSFFRNCIGQDGGIPYSLLPFPLVAGGNGGAPPFPMQAAGRMVTDSFDPIWSGTVSNVGKYSGGGGSHRALVRFGWSASFIANINSGVSQVVVTSMLGGTIPSFTTVSYRSQLDGNVYGMCINGQVSGTTGGVGTYNLSSSTVPPTTETGTFMVAGNYTIAG